MKKSLADGIEQYIKVLIARSENRQIQIQRTELAETFACVPSQITYVLGTRFTQSDGYYTESRRGVKGFMRISQIKAGPRGTAEQKLLQQLVHDLGRQKLLHDRETELLQHIINHATVNIPSEYQGQVSLGIRAGLRKFLEIEAGIRGNEDVM